MSVRSLCAAALVVACTLAHADVPPVQSGAPFVLAPYVQDVRTDGFTVAFETADAVDAEVRAGSVRVATHGTRHEATLRGLKGARAHYVVTIGGQALADGDVVLPDPRRPLELIVYGDTRDAGGVDGEAARAAAALHPDLVLHTGDLVAAGNDEAAWREFFANAAPLMRDVPLYPAIGNHEIYRDRDASRFRARFVLPDQGRDRLYYQFRFGPAQFIVLDGNRPSAEQTGWLRGALEAAERERVPHVFVLVHQPPLSLGDHCGAAPAEADWLTLFEEHHVRAVFAGHDHAYARMERRGVRYFVSGGGGAPVYAEHECAGYDRAAKRVYLPVHHLLRVRVDATNVEVAALPIGQGVPLDVVAFGPNEAPFAMDAPPLAPTAVVAHRASTPPWMLVVGGVAFFVVGALVRRKKAR